MATVHREGNLDLLSGKVAVFGYGSQGHAHALNLKDSGVQVVVSLQEQSRSRERAEAAGVKVVPAAEATRWADVLVILVPDTTQPALYRDFIAPNLTAGKTLLFAHGFNI